MLKNWKKLHITSVEQIPKKGLKFSINFDYFCQPRQSIKFSRGFPNFSLIILKEEPKSATGLHRQRAKLQNAHCDAVVIKICKNEGVFIDFITGWEKASLTTPVNSGWSTWYNTQYSPLFSPLMTCGVGKITECYLAETEGIFFLITRKYARKYTWK